MKITRAVVPSLFTTLNIFCGFLSILNSHQGNIQLASWFIVLAAGFDAFDGIMARITRSSSQFGVELDSLADVVSFGAAPAFMIYQAHLSTWGNLGIMISALPLILGAIRLARFNVQLVGFDKDHFNGLPIPGQAIAVCAFMLEYYVDEQGLIGYSQMALAPLVIILSLLMVSHIKYDTLPKLSKKGIAAHPWKVVGYGVAGLAVIFSKGKLFFLVLMAFIAFGILRAAWKSVRRWMSRSETEQEEGTEVSSIDI